MRSKKIIVLLCLLFANSYAQQQAPVPQLIPGLSNDIAQFVPAYIVETADSWQNCSETFHNLSCINKQWRALVQPQETKVPLHFSGAHKALALALSKKFSLSPALAVSLGVYVVKERMKKFDQEIEKQVEKLTLRENFTIQYNEFTWPHQCLGYAIRQNKKDIVKFLCSLKYINTNAKIASDRGEIPLLAEAILYNHDENDLTIIDCLLNSRTQVHYDFILIRKEEGSSATEENNNNNNIEERIKFIKREKCTPLLLAKQKNKQKIVAKLEEHSKQREHKLQEDLEKFLRQTN